MLMCSKDLTLVLFNYTFLFFFFIFQTVLKEPFEIMAFQAMSKSVVFCHTPFNLLPLMSQLVISLNTQFHLN